MLYVTADDTVTCGNPVAQNFGADLLIIGYTLHVRSYCSGLCFLNLHVISSLQLF
jgi:hypothetical protein